MNENLLPSFPIAASGPISQAFLERGISNFKDAAEFVRTIPYGRTESSKVLLVLEENCGTCSSKHALLAELASECSFPIKLMMGIYLMNNENTPGVGTEIQDLGLKGIPEAHCYLSFEGRRLDLTKPSSPIEPQIEFLLEEEITPEQTVTYKGKKHKEFVSEWLDSEQSHHTSDEIWSLRERCIANLSSK